MSLALLVFGFIAAVLLLIWWGNKLETARERREVNEHHGVKISKATGGAYADTEEVVESELDRIRAGEDWKMPQK